MTSKEHTSWFQRLMSISIWEKEEPVSSKPKSSGKGVAGHRDPTADAAIANVMREEKRKKDKDRNAKNNKADNRKADDRKGGEENA